jgi:hypothetical protein
MLTALILVCSVAVTPGLRGCTPRNATAMMRLPVQSENPAICFMQGQTYIAQSAIGHELGANDSVKLVCARSEVIDAVARRHRPK